MKKRASILRSDMNSIVTKNKKKKKLVPVHHVDDDLFTRKEETRDDSYSTEDENDEQAAASSRNISHGYHKVRGKMEHGMEDYVVAENRKINGHHLGLYAIFDSHSGRHVAKYLQSHLFDNILSENPKRAIKKAYKVTDNEILDNIVGSPGGSMAVTAILIDQRRLIVANVGDSQAVLCRNGVAKPLSVDHEPEKARELVESKGGFVSKMPGNVPRVDGQLATTRAFGDGKLKEHITSEPDLTSKMIDEDDEFLVLASDGLWKVEIGNELRIKGPSSNGYMVIHKLHS
ncbi:hypothetical protein P3X46_031477 [Hevea brasiliensis]|uniref:PPM-type phosphatase domain-containing protein n=1 Tax=Hevea brasiliensis TaxID=3981 RepID=A0ABQ9KLZ3_HEVBR|nr:hypothetical protein P3X46_031477 [Hevea brasiliensis]